MELLLNEDFTFLNDLPIVREVDNLRERIDAMRPLAKDIEARIMQKLRLEWNYNSNAIEGNSLDYGETVALLMHGVTAKGKPLKDYFDIEGHNLVIDYLAHFVKHEEALTEKEIRSMHEMMLVKPYENLSKAEDGRTVQRKIHLGQYKVMPNHVETRTGEIHYYATPEDTPMLMHDLVNWYQRQLNDKRLHPLVIASVFHHRFTAIHPFDDGNGRMSRLLMNLILMRFGYPPAVIKNVNKHEYFATLSQADIGIYEPFVIYIGSSLLSSMNIYIRGANGESLDDASDFRKKLLLFKKELEARRDKIEVKRSLDVQQAVYNDSVVPFINKLSGVVSDLKDLFISSSENILNYDTRALKWNYKMIHLTEGMSSFFQTPVQNEHLRIFNIRFEDFKLAGNPFSVDLNIAVWLQDFRYVIRYGVLNGNILPELRQYQVSQWLNKHDSISKYYHQVVDEEDLEVFVGRIANNVLSCIKDILDGVVEPDPDMEELQKTWDKVVEKSDDLTAEKKSVLKDPSSYSAIRKNPGVEIRLNNNLASSIKATLARDLYHSLYEGKYIVKNNFVSISEEPPF
nr:Fic family protein [uncultured Dyadobacter sp.]